jgi:hypothetical protein
MRAELREHLNWTVTATIANGGTASGAIDIQHAVRGWIKNPGTVTASTMTFEVSDDGTNWNACVPAVTVTSGFAANAAVPIPTILFGARFLRIVSTTTGQAETFIVYLKA